MLWSEQVPLAEAGQWAAVQGYRERGRRLHDLLASESQCVHSYVLGEPSRQQVVRPLNSSSSYLLQSLQPLAFRHGFGMDFEKYC